MGAETEYGFSSKHDESCEFLLRNFRAGNSCLPGHHSSGYFLAGGGRVSIDQSHPEYSTPECLSPYELVACLEAGDRLIAPLAKRRARGFVWKGNVDYSSESTWGSHESYLYSQATLGDIAHLLIPFLVSRIIIAGGGGFSPHDGIVFSLSPRSWYLTELVSQNSTRDRPLIHTRDEALCAGGDYHRLHLICGDSLQSQKGSVLRFGTTALVLALIEAGVQVGDSVQLADPLAAIRTFAADPTCRVTALSCDGRPLSPLELQYHYLEAVTSHLHESFMPEWASAVCDLWRRTLNDLSQGAPETVGRQLDWSIKLSIFNEHAIERGFSWDGLRHWNTALKMMKDLDVRPTMSSAPAAVEKYLRDHDLSSRQLPSVLSLRNELFEIDMRYGDLQDSGLFRTLDTDGVLDHRVAGVPDPELAMNSPPRGRAAVRGNWIKRLSTGKKRHYVAEWQGIFDRRSKQWLDLTDPFTTNAEWQPLDGAKMAAAGLRMIPRSPQSAAIAEVWECYRAGKLSKVARLLESLMLNEPLPSELTRLSAWVRAKLGLADGHEILDRLYAQRTVTLDTCADYLQVWRYSFLQPDSRMISWITKGQQILNSGQSPRCGTSVVFKEYAAGYFMSDGQHEQALSYLQEALRDERSGIDDLRIVARILCDQAEVSRRMGNISGALRSLHQARRIQLLGEYRGDYANYNLTCRAKLLTDKSSALKALQQARSLQQRLGDTLGRARTLLLECRLRSDPGKAPAYRAALGKLQARLPALQQCPTFARITSRWDDWVGNQAPEEETGDTFWGI
jgi:tetratricopeptide (TPR) repeat protein